MQVSTIINRQDIHYMNITNKCNKQSKIYYGSDKYNMEGAYIYILSVVGKPLCNICKNLIILNWNNKRIS